MTQAPLPAALDPQGAASALRLAAEQLQAIAPLRDRLQDASPEAAYAIQEANTSLWLEQGRRLAGRKIGLTSLAVQAQLGVDQPDFGMLFDDMSVGDGETIAAGRLIQPKAEAEVALVLGRDLSHERHTYADLIRATEYCLPAIEVVDSRIADWNIRFVDTVADNASSGLFVLGSRPVLLRDIDLTDCAMEMHCDGVPVSRGNGRACLGNPLNAAVWLANTMVRCGRPLQAGDIVLTGALGPMAVVRGGQHFSVHIAGMGHVSVSFE
ncbi:2-keto-4-pentenoate hydratase [Kerstersia gyiorum]|uniref:2-keto-4-pentenoate hydratase n=1 Tax=Kerstersia gyiorum TaxID=206506 RepID=A0A4Q7MB65_9BURK|nr:fumarylacetoacetate hydrolase family protein [Kerstersia gyiorum]KAB0542198.1 2-keto-4-pentenoate hydratase [Kerstersia gyiorum]RZS65236.1 2-keto-4-pentenoate hydratase [Kerstersia gyiorum]